VPTLLITSPLRAERSAPTITGVDFAFGHHLGYGAIRYQRHRHARLRELPRGQARALQVRSGFCGDDSEGLTQLFAKMRHRDQFTANIASASSPAPGSVGSNAGGRRAEQREQLVNWPGKLLRARVARAAGRLRSLPNPARVMTHCNVSGELVAVAHFCKELVRPSLSSPQKPDLTCKARA